MDKNITDIEYFREWRFRTMMKAYNSDVNILVKRVKGVKWSNKEKVKKKIKKFYR